MKIYVGAAKKTGTRKALPITLSSRAFAKILLVEIIGFEPMTSRM